MAEPSMVAFVVSADAPATRNATIRTDLLVPGVRDVRVGGLDLRAASVGDLDALVDQDLCRRSYGRPLTPAEVGCAHGHRMAWASVVDSRAAWGLVVEDDTTVCGDLEAALASVALLDARQPWLVALHASAIADHPLVAGPVLTPGVHRLAVTWHGACAYVVSAAAARILLAGPVRVGTVADWPPEAARCRLAAVLPLPMSTGAYTSTIQAQRAATGVALRGSSLRDRYQRYVGGYLAVRPRVGGYRAYARWWNGAGAGVNRQADRLAARGWLGWRREDVAGTAVVRRVGPPS